jgi:hypothetical protein
MIKKTLVLTSFAAGYVLGSKAGHERYEQIRKLVLGVKNDPRVQDAAGEAAGIAKEVGVGVTDKVTDVVQDKILHRDEPQTEADLRPHGASMSDPLGAPGLST